MQTKCRVMSDQIEAIYSRDIPPSRHVTGSLCLLCFIVDLVFSLTNDDYTCLNLIHFDPWLWLRAAEEYDVTRLPLSERSRLRDTLGDPKKGCIGLGSNGTAQVRLGLC